MEVTIVIPNYNGLRFLEDCLTSLEAQSYPAHILVVDNGSTDGSVEWIRENHKAVRVIALKENTGFSKAVNIGIRKSETPYVILLNNDTKVKEGFTEALLRAIKKSERIFSVSAKMLDMKNEEIIDSAGDLYCALGWAYARGKGKPQDKYNVPAKIFSACAGAAIYRKSVFAEIGYFDELHFAYLEDLDIGWRARIYGYENRYEPLAAVLHMGSASSGSRYNLFKTGLSSANSVYVIGKNMPFLQWVLNLPFLVMGYSVKTLFFIKKGMGAAYVKGCMRGLRRCFSEEGRKRKVRFRLKHLGSYCRIQGELWCNILRRL